MVLSGTQSALKSALFDIGRLQELAHFRRLSAQNPRLIHSASSGAEELYVPGEERLNEMLELRR